MLGCSFPNNISLYIGPEVNVLLKKMTNIQSSRAVEVGLSAKSSYRLNNLLIELGYFKGVSPFSTQADPIFKYFNQNGQIGLSYKFKRAIFCF